jgi:solute carrier family 8 (sodium/calcium exchanger)
MADNVTMAIGNATTTIRPGAWIDVYNYTCSDRGLMFPLVNEYTWSIGARTFIYLLGMLWCFLAVSIIADVFMGAIERITSKTTKLRIPDDTNPQGFRELDVKVWNDTVANLSLLALGTSAPEILLSVIEIVGNNFVAGTLGPGTIVGSAAFNLLVISGICVVCIPDGEVRKVMNLKVYAVTASSCILAYVWLFIVIKVWTPEKVTLQEAIITFAMFPTLIGVAYLADRNFCLGKKKQDETGEVGFDLGK